MSKIRLLLAMALLSPTLQAEQQHYVLFRAEPAVAEILGSETQEKLLPTLEFPFRLDAACRAPATLARLSLGVADIRRSWSSSDSAISVEESLVIPANQTAPVMANFCLAEDGGVRQLIRSVLTAQIALTCSAGESRTIEYQSVPLDVELACEQPPPDDSVPVDSSQPSDEPDSAGESVNS